MPSIEELQATIASNKLRKRLRQATKLLETDAQKRRRLARSAAENAAADAESRARNSRLLQIITPRRSTSSSTPRSAARDNGESDEE